LSDNGYKGDFIADRLLNNLDEDNDGQISLDEFKAFVEGP
jgi:Ca2+-binding EF-hand superfamily protein